MFDLKCKSDLPLDFIEVQQIWVRGGLGPMTIWVTEGGFAGKHERGTMWR
jgi:hypothetical protein